MEDKPEENVRAKLPLRATRQNQTEGSSLVFSAAWELGTNSHKAGEEVKAEPRSCPAPGPPCPAPPCPAPKCTLDSRRVGGHRKVYLKTN